MNDKINIRELYEQRWIHIILIIWCSVFNMLNIENVLFNIATWFNVMKINRCVDEIRDVVELVFSFSNESRQDLESIFNSFDLIECSDIISFVMNDVQHDINFDVIEFEIMIDLKIVNITKLFQIDLNVVIQLIKIRFDSILEIVSNDVLKNIIFSIINVSLIEYVIDVFIKKFTIRDDKFQFIFKKNFRVDINSIVVLNEMKNFRKIVDRWKFNDDYVDDQIENLLHKSSIR
jgi:hypothetical protein